MREILTGGNRFAYSSRRTRSRANFLCAASPFSFSEARRTSDAFVGILHDVLRLCKPEREIHIILDNLSAHKTQKVEAFLDQHSHVQLHFTPAYSSWLNQVEIWFARIEREVFTSVRDLARKLMRYIQAYSKSARPFDWKYSDVRHRVKAC